jgi:hypothetical protein
MQREAKRCPADTTLLPCTLGAKVHMDSLAQIAKRGHGVSRAVPTQAPYNLRNLTPRNNER